MPNSVTDAEAMRVQITQTTTLLSAHLVECGRRYAETAAAIVEIRAAISNQDRREIGRLFVICLTLATTMGTLLLQLMHK